jgi:hypothetical protein
MESFVAIFPEHLEHYTEKSSHPGVFSPRSHMITRSKPFASRILGTYYDNFAAHALKKSILKRAHYKVLLTRIEGLLGHGQAIP